MVGETSVWPEQLLEHLRVRHGELAGIERLGGWSVAEVWRVRFEGSSVVVKATRSAVEPAFYDRVAPELRAARVPIPEVELNLEAEGRHWLVLEHLPEPFVPPLAERWAPDPAVVAALASLHSATRRRTFDLPETAAGTWTPAMTSSALSLFPEGVAASLEDALRQYEARAAALAGPWCWISGDPSPPNWGRRADGTLALFDWELFRPGVPATDLAITVPGLPTREMFALAAEAYVALPESAGLAWSPADLVEQMCVAKVGTVVAMLAAQASGRARVPKATVAWLIEGLPGWLESVGTG
ncbi:MAG: phosphotransferase family protein [Tepidiformaceae bacterium]